jgi:hypothetical protein
MFSVRAAIRLLLCAACALSMGCAAIFGSSGPSEVARGQRYHSGVPKYDQFFEDLHELQRAMAVAPKHAEDLQIDLADDLDLDEDSSKRLIEKRLAKGTEQLVKNGVEFKLEFVGLEDEEEEADARITTDGQRPSGRDADFVSSVQDTAKDGARLIVKMRDVRRLARKLNAQLPVLEAQVATEFHLLGPARQKDVNKNLYDAKLMLPLILDLSSQVNGDVMGLLTVIEQGTRAEDAEGYRQLAEGEEPADDKDGQQEEQAEAGEADKSKDDKSKSAPQPKSTGKPTRPAGIKLKPKKKDSVVTADFEP